MLAGEPPIRLPQGDDPLGMLAKGASHGAADCASADTCAALGNLTVLSYLVVQSVVFGNSVVLAVLNSPIHVWGAPKDGESHAATQMQSPAAASKLNAAPWDIQRFAPESPTSVIDEPGALPAKTAW